LEPNESFQITQVIIAQTLAGCACGISGMSRPFMRVRTS
jgi:hypothetical protein